jgi:hypothetical protein
MAYLQNHDRNPRILDIADQTVVADLFRHRETFAQKVDYYLLGWTMEFSDLLFGRASDFNRPSQDAAPTL